MEGTGVCHRAVTLEIYQINVPADAVKRGD